MLELLNVVVLIALLGVLYKLYGVLVRNVGDKPNEVISEKETIEVVDNNTDDIQSFGKAVELLGEFTNDSFYINDYFLHSLFKIKLVNVSRKYDLVIKDIKFYINKVDLFNYGFRDNGDLFVIKPDELVREQLTIPQSRASNIVKFHRKFKIYMNEEISFEFLYFSTALKKMLEDFPINEMTSNVNFYFIDADIILTDGSILNTNKIPLYKIIKNINNISYLNLDRSIEINDKLNENDKKRSVKSVLTTLPKSTLPSEVTENIIESQKVNNTDETDETDE